MVNFDASVDDTLTIHEIGKKYAQKAREWIDGDYATRDQVPSQIDIEMDVTACHLNGNPLDLKRLLDADDFNFVHDIIGIHEHLNRETGELMDCFVPRFSAREKAVTA